jgi:asparagine synthase (glutamine-hydrolysing)
LASDARLILHAYHVWGEDCVEHLLGDFAFAIWDGRARRLFCARDHFGVKPFYYARVGRTIVLSNTLDCVRLHPAVGDRLNELAIGDFLLFCFNQEPTTTTFADVQRLPPAHSLTVGEGAASQKRYWTLPTGGRIRYQRSFEYVDHFNELLRAAVGDRIGPDRVGIWMSGGVDSVSIAAAAREIRSAREAGSKLHAHTTVFDTLIPDRERHYSGVAAQALGIEIHYLCADGYRPLDGWDRFGQWTPEPPDDPFLLLRHRQFRQAASYGRVLLCGEGGDEVLWRSTVVDLLGRIRLPELSAGVVASLVRYGRRPDAGIRARMMQWLGYPPQRPPYPEWLNLAFANRLHLRERWEELSAPRAPGDHALRAEAYRKLTTPTWAWYAESCDAGVTRAPLELRYPFLDVRLVAYLLAIPPIPWFVDKQILRRAMKGRLPEAVRCRPKAPLAGDPLRAHLRESGISELDTFEAVPELAQYVNRAAIPRMAGECGSSDPWLNVRPFCLNRWLKRAHPGVRDLEVISNGHETDGFGPIRRGRSGEEIVRDAAIGGLR